MLFNRPLHRKRRDRTAVDFSQVDFIKREICHRLADRLFDIDRSFERAVDLGCHLGELREAIPPTKIQHLIPTDFSAQMAGQIICDEEALPFREQSLDAILSVGGLHWVNDLPGTLIQARRALKPDGLLLAAMPGPRSLQELREAALAAGTKRGKLAPHIAPFVETRDAGALLQRAGFALPVIDSETLNLTYREFSTLLKELQQMGESNALNEQHKGLTSPSYWRDVEVNYPRDAAGLFPVTLEVIFLTAWSPHESQQQPARRGSGQISMKDVL
jgi:SAM-dependent methyltransferase